jgi:hypothetical protein
MAHQFEPLKNDLILRTAKGVYQIISIHLEVHDANNCRRESRARADVGDAAR